jgi:hypothetical protein
MRSAAFARARSRLRAPFAAGIEFNDAIEITGKAKHRTAVSSPAADLAGDGLGGHLEYVTTATVTDRLLC